MSGQSGSGGDGWDEFLSGLKVMVVDDDPLCLKVVEHMLRRCSYTGIQRLGLTSLNGCHAPPASCTMFAVTTCPNGVTALERLRDKNQHYDLVLSDVYMPGIDAAFNVKPFAHPCLPLCMHSCLPLCMHPCLPLWLNLLLCADVDGFKLLEQIGLELDLPVISKH